MGIHHFIGRERELRELRAAFNEVCTGQGHLIFLEGEPGIGKTRTAQEFALVAHQCQALVLVGRCYEGEGAPPYWPWVQIVRAYLATHEATEVRQHLGAGADDIALVIPELRSYAPDAPSPALVVRDQERFRFFDSFTAFLQNVAKEQPLVLILDDLHWADAPSLLLLQHLAQELSQLRILLIGAQRNAPLPPTHPLALARGDIVRRAEAHSMSLKGFSEEEVAHFIEVVTNQIPSPTLTATLYQQTEGNPFFVSELVRLLTASGEPLPVSRQQVLSTLTLPHRVREAVLRRLVSLSKQCRELLSIASVIGREFDAHVLGAALAKPPFRMAEPGVLEVIDEAVTARLIIPTSEMRLTYSFSHALIRETLYEDLPAGRRVRLHQRIGDILEERFRASVEPPWAELAHHFFRGLAEEGNFEKAVDYACRAATHARASLAYEDAAFHYEQALQALESRPGREAQRCELLLELGQMRRQISDLTSAKETYQKAADLARKLAPQVGKLRAVTLLGRAALGFAGEWISTVGMVDYPVVALIKEALLTLGEGDPALRARLLARLAMELWFSAPQDHKERLMHEAVSCARRSGDDTALAHTLHMHNFVLWDPRNVKERLNQGSEIVALATRVGDRALTLEGYSWRISGLLEKGDPTALDAELALHSQLAEEWRHPLYRLRSMWWVIMRLLLRGRFAEAEQAIQQGLTFGQKAQFPQGAQLFFGVQMFMLRREQGRLQELVPLVKGATEQPSEFPILRYWPAALYSELEDTGNARHEFARLSAQEFTDLPQDITRLLALAILAQTCAFLADMPQAKKLYMLLSPYAAYNIVYGNGLIYHDPVAYHLGLLATILGRWSEAEAHFEAATTMTIRLGAYPRLAHSQYAYARMLLARNRAGDKARAEGLLKQAQATAQELGMMGLAEKILLLGSRFSLLAGKPAINDRHPERKRSRPSPTQHSASQTQPSIFRREGDYWTIAYQGVIVRLKSIRGLYYIAQLLRHPHQEFHVFDLVDLPQMETGSRTEARPSSTLEHQRRLLTTHHTEETLLDVRARTAYRKRLRELQEELHEAQTFQDLGRMTELQQEREFLTHQLSAAMGVGGHPRQAAPQVERVRVNVTRGIKEAIQKIAPHSPQLERYLSTTIRTGLFCAFAPDPFTPVYWLF